jgi:hypothetical protein
MSINNNPCTYAPHIEDFAFELGLPIPECLCYGCSGVGEAPAPVWSGGVSTRDPWWSEGDVF